MGRYDLLGEFSVSHEIAKLLLEHAGTFLARQEATESAVYMGMPLREIEQYLDWLDTAGTKRDGDEEVSV